MADDKNAPVEKEDVEEVEVLDEAEGTAIPEAGASGSNSLCCSACSSTCSSSSAG